MNQPELKSMTINDNLSTSINMNKSESKFIKWMNMNEHESKLINMSQDASKWIKVNQHELKLIKMNQLSRAYVYAHLQNVCSPVYIVRFRHHPNTKYENAF